MKTKESEATKLGWQLKELRSEMNRLKALDTKTTLLFKKACQEEKVNEAGGYRINRNPYGKLVVSDGTAAMEWVKEYPAALKIDTGVAHDIFQLSHGDPAKHGFAYEETIRVEAVKNVDQND